jgi:hypothetical protein
MNSDLLKNAVGADNQDGELAAAREKALAMDSAEKILDAILSHPRAGELVRSTTCQDFFVLVHEIGPEDSLEILRLASDEQVISILDMACWHRDRANLAAFDKWMGLLAKAEPRRLARLIREDETGSLALWLYNSASIALPEEDEDISNLPGDYFTIDGAFFVSVLPRPQETETQFDERTALMREILSRVADQDFDAYRAFLFHAAGVIPSQVEEEAYRLKTVRLAEQGFDPFEESIAIYTKIKKEDFFKAPQKKAPSREDLQQAGLVPYFSTHSPDMGLFGKALSLVKDSRQLMGLQSEFAVLCNKLIVADSIAIEGRANLNLVVKKAGGYLSLGLEDLAQNNAAKAADILRHYPLARIFGFGHGLALSLAFKARKWQANAWFAKQGLALTFWPEKEFAVLGGLFLPRPLFAQITTPGEAYRDFACLDDINRTQGILDKIIAIDSFMGLMDWDERWFALEGANAFNVLLTAFARHLMGLEPIPKGLSKNELVLFFGRLFSGRGKNRRISNRVKGLFLRWVAKSSGKKEGEISELAGFALEDIFREIDEQYFAVDARHLEGRFVPHILTETDSKD